MKKQLSLLVLLILSKMNVAFERQLILRGKSATTKPYSESDNKNVAAQNYRTDQFVRGIRNMMPGAVVTTCALGICCGYYCCGLSNSHAIEGGMCMGLGACSLVACMCGCEDGCDQISASNVCNEHGCLKKCGTVITRDCCYGSGCCPLFVLKRLDDLIKKDKDCEPFTHY